MRRHAKAPSAGSIQRQGVRLGRFFRGAFATRGLVGDAAGTGAPSTRRALRALLVLCLAIAAAMALLVSPALAAKTRPYTGLSFGPNGTTATSFSSVQGVAVDQASDEVYVYDAGAGKIYKFDASGNPVNFSALSGNAIEGVGGAGDGEEEIAIAPVGSPSGTAGDIYAANNSVVQIYGPSGTQLGALTGPEPCGVATSPTGHVFVGNYSSEVREYTPSANPVTDANQSAASSGVVSGICNVAADGLGNIYAANYAGGGLFKLAGIGAASATTLDPSANTLAIDPSNNDVYANRRSEVAQYDSSGTLLLTFGTGQLAGSQGIAVNSDAEEIYAGNNGSGKVDVFGPPTVVAGLAVEPPTGLTGSKATLNASVNPDGLEVTECKFEYGTTTAYGSSKPCEGAIPTDSSDHPVAASLTGLTPSTTYHFRIVATNINGTNRSGDQTFTTSLPAVTNPATGITGTKATLNGTVFPEGEAVTDCKFEYGSSDSYGSSLPCEGVIPTDEGEHPVTAALTGLTINTTYHFRIVAANATGTSKGGDQTFTTSLPAVTNPATGITGTKATLNGTVFPEGEAVTDCFFEYGVKPAYDSSIPCEESIPTDEGEHAVTGQVSHLFPNGTEYQFRLVINRGSGIVRSSEQIFFTQDTVITGAATAINPPTATVEGTLNPEGIPYTDCNFEYGRTGAYGETAPCAEPLASIGEGTSPVPVHADLSGLAFGTTYHYRLAGSNVDGTARGADRTFETPGAVIEAEWASSVVTAEATLKATINPRGSATTYHLEYGTDTSYGQSTPESNVGSDGNSHTVVNALEGLELGTTYHYRFVASNSVGVSQAPDRTFTTYVSARPGTNCPTNQQFRTGLSAALPDCRAYELVTPLDKDNGDVVTRINGTGYDTAVNQSALDGEGLTYTSYHAFTGAQAAEYANQLLSKRGPEGWQNESINPRRDGASPLDYLEQLENQYTAFSSDLSSAWLLRQTEPVLNPCVPAGFAALYRRDNFTGEYEALSCVHPTRPSNEVKPEIQGFTADGRRSFFRVEDKLTPDGSDATRFGRPVYQAYESTAGGQLRLISVLPNGEASDDDSTVGTATDQRVNQNRESNVAHAVSQDGSHVFWSASAANGTRVLYLRRNADREQSVSGACDEPGKACTVQVSVNAEPKYVRFETANPAGTKALYTVNTSVGQVESAALYEFEADAEPPVSHQIAEGIQGSILGSSEDLSRIYFASIEASPQAQSEGAVAGRPNVYLMDDGTPRFVAVLSSTPSGQGRTDMGNDYGTPVRVAPFRHTARVSPNGDLVFMSNSRELSERIAGYDNTDASSGEPDAEVYLYDADASSGAGKLRCVSCNPSGVRPTGRQIGRGNNSEGPGYWGAALVTRATTQLYQPRYLSDDGNRVFFDSFDALVLADTNGRRDVYQWEASGTGGCEPQSPSYFVSSEGCIDLVSSGQSPADSAFIDAGGTGGDVFFTTAESLLQQDPGSTDLYDARAGGGFAPPQGPAAACEGEACQGPLRPPNDPTPASAAFDGAGNVKEKAKARCAKGKARHKGRCVSKKKSKRASKGSTKRRANDHRRAGR